MRDFQVKPASTAGINLVAFAMFGAALWLCTRPFTLSDNDTQIYSLMALAWREPGRFDDDLFFKFGSQDSYSLFSPLYGTFIGWFGLPGANAILLLLSAAVWLCGSWRLCHRLIDAPFKAGAAFVGVAAFHMAYAGFGVLFPGEGQLTSRLIAEGFGLLALSYLLDRRWTPGLALIVLAGLLHPLMTVGTAAIAGLTLAFYRPRLLLLLPVGVASVFALGLAHIGPFDHLFRTVDPAWLEQVRNRNAFVLLETWAPQDWARCLVQALIVLSAAMVSVGTRRRALIATVAVAVLGLLVSWIGGDRLHNALIIQIQLWRMVWPMAWAALPALAILTRPKLGPAGWIAPVIFLGAFFNPWTFLIVAAGLTGLMASVLPHRISRNVAFALLAAAVIVLLAYFLRAIFYTGVRYTLNKQLGFERYTLMELRGYAWILVPLVILGIQRFPRIATGAAAVCLAVALSTWDQRSPWDRYVTSSETPPLEVKGPVLWTAYSDATWFLLKKPAFVSFQQASALLLSREQALTWRDRMRTSQGVMPLEIWVPVSPMRSCDFAEHRTTAAEFAAMCSAPDRPGSLITSTPIVGVQAASKFATPVTHDLMCAENDALKRISRKDFYVYPCPDAKP